MSKPKGTRPEPTDELATLRRRLEEATAKVKEQDDLLVGSEMRIRGLEAEVERLRAVQPTPTHAVRSFEAGARAERKRALEQARVSALQWGGNVASKRALDTFVAELRDERLPLPEFKP